MMPLSNLDLEILIFIFCEKLAVGLKMSKHGEEFEEYLTKVFFAPWFCELFVSG